MMKYRSPHSINNQFNLPLNSTIQVTINKKVTPCKTTSLRKNDLVEAKANGKKYLCRWISGEWIGQQI